MSFVKQSLILYSVCVLALVYNQCEFTSALNCILCNSTAVNTSNSYCDASELDTASYNNCISSNGCFEILSQDGDTETVLRGCELNCDSDDLKDFRSKNYSCIYCETDLCNNKAISITAANSSAATNGITFGSLLLSAAVTLYLY